MILSNYSLCFFEMRYRLLKNQADAEIQVLDFQERLLALSDRMIWSEGFGGSDTVWLLNQVESDVWPHLMAKKPLAVIHTHDLHQLAAGSLNVMPGLETYLSPRIASLIGVLPGRELLLLTPAPLKIARGILLGLSNLDMAQRMYRSIETIQNHRKHLKRTLGVNGGKFSLVTALFPHTAWIMKMTESNEQCY